MLTKTQAIAASHLFQRRPPVLDGTRVILDDGQREAFYAEVTKTMKTLGLNDMNSVNEFCDLAGVPD